MRLNKDDVIEKVTDIHIKNLVLEFGASISEDDKVKMICTTICHGGASQKLYYYKESKSFYCYSECGSMSIIDFIMQVRKYNFTQALNFLANKIGYTYKNSFISKKEDKLKKELEELMGIIPKENTIKSIPKIPIINPKILDRFDNLYREEWLEDNISSKAMREFSIKYYSYRDKIVIPHYNADNNLIGIRTRNFEEWELEKGMKYTPLYLQGKMYNHPLQFNFYGINKNKENIKRKKAVVLVEGEKAVLQAETYYGRDNNITLAICGSNVSLWHKNYIINELKVHRIYLALDKQWQSIKTLEYEKWVKKIDKIIKMFSPYIDVYILWDSDNLLGYKDSPFDRGYYILEEMFNRKIRFNGFKEEKAIFKKEEMDNIKIKSIDYVNNEYLITKN